MNEDQKNMVKRWSIGYSIMVFMFASLYYFKNPMPILLLIMMLVALLGGKKYRYDKERTEIEMQEFVEYSKKHITVLIAIAIYAVALPIVLLVLARRNYIIIEFEQKSWLKYSLLAAFPLLLLDIGHKTYKYKQAENLTEHLAPLDRE